VYDHQGLRAGVCACIAAALLVSACGGEGAESLGSEQGAVKSVSVDARRSLAVTEQSILSRFSLQRVMTQLAVQSGVAGLTPTQLFQQWWDTQNPAPGLYAGPHCDDVVDGAGNPQLNGYPYFCRASAEGAQAACDPFAEGSSCAYLPIGLFNRFDLAPENGAHCGEYRIVYAKASGLVSTSDRNLLIFEAVLPNPRPQQGVKGCKQIVKIWTDLTDEAAPSARADVLEDFYFDGQAEVGPVISVANFGDNALGVGQIRTNQFSNTTTGWSLREFKLLRTCSGATCSAMRFVPHANKNNAFGPLFAAGSPLPAASTFETYFPTQVAGLAAASLTQIDINVPDVYDSGQSQASGATASEMRYPDHFAGATTLRTAIQTELTSLGSGLTPEEIVLRAQTQTCAGCHRLSNNAVLGGGLVWPPSLGFVHVSERETEVVGGETRFKLSDALNNALLPARKQIVDDFMNDMPRPSKGPDHPLSGSNSHG
jgi:hypothetical protein